MSPLAPEALESLLAGEGIVLPPGGAEALSRHAREMLRWNRAIRLTAITDSRDVAVKHILDSLFLLRLSDFDGDILDFGSGAGYPGIPIAVACPGARVTLLEATAKKCAFLSRMVAFLPLRNAVAVNERLSGEKRLPIGPFGRIVTRATLSPDAAVPLLAPYLAPGGRILLMTGGEEEGRGPAAGEGAHPPRNRGAVYLEESRAFDLPHGMGRRRIVVYRKPA